MTGRLRGWLLVAAALAAALAVAWWSARSTEAWPGDLDPRNPGPAGGQALARVLADEGVGVEVARSADALEDQAVDAATTVVATSTEALSPGTLARLRTHARPGRLVLVDPPPWLVAELADTADDDPAGALGSRTVRPDPDDGIGAECTATPTVALDGLRLEVDVATAFTGATGPACFPVGRGALLVEDLDRDVVLLGAGSALANDTVLRGDNAAVGLRLLGGGERLVWYVPDPADAVAGDTVSVAALLPRWIGPALWLLALSTVALVAWRVRRLGPLSTEPLPVVVRAAETAHSRGRLYRRSGDRAHAARTLRRAARSDLAARLRLDPHADGRQVGEAAARHLGVAASDLRPLLDDDAPPPASDQDLVALAQQLTHLRREVRRG